MSIKSTLAVSAAVTAVVLVILAQLVRAWLRVARIRKRNEAFGERFKRSSLSDLGTSSLADTHPAPLDTSTRPPP